MKAKTRGMEQITDWAGAFAIPHQVRDDEVRYKSDDEERIITSAILLFARSLGRGVRGFLGDLLRVLSH